MKRVQFQNEFLLRSEAFSPADFSFLIPINSAAPSSVVLHFRINRLYRVKREKSHLIIFTIFCFELKLQVLPVEYF